MQAGVWVHGAVFALAIAQFFVFWYLYRRSGMSSTHETKDRVAAGGDVAEGPGDHHVACPNCGTRNTARFEYCHNCVEELPRGARAS